MYNFRVQRDDPCIHCGYTEYFWFDYYEYKLNKR